MGQDEMTNLIEKELPVFRSALSMEEIENNFKNIDFFSGLMEGLEEALAYEKGNPFPNIIVRERTME